MEGRQERVEPLDRAHDLSSLSGEVEAVARADRSMQQCPPDEFETTTRKETLYAGSLTEPSALSVKAGQPHW